MLPGFRGEYNPPLQTSWPTDRPNPHIFFFSIFRPGSYLWMPTSFFEHKSDPIFFFLLLFPSTIHNSHLVGSLPSYKKKLSSKYLLLSSISGSGQKKKHLGIFVNTSIPNLRCIPYFQLFMWIRLSYLIRSCMYYTSSIVRMFEKLSE